MGPLHGLKVIEFAGIGPGPFCAMLFSDMGAEVIRIERRGAARRTLSPLNLGPYDVTGRGAAPWPSTSRSPWASRRRSG